MDDQRRSILAFSPWIDLPLALVCYLVLTLSFLFWIRRGNPIGIENTIAMRWQIMIRSAIVLGIPFALCAYGDISFWLVMALVPVLGVVSVFILSEVGGTVLGPISILLMFLREFILGFPELILRPAASPPSLPTPSIVIAGREGIPPIVATTTSPLRPYGVIEIDGQGVSAVSENGAFIDVGCSVHVTEIRGSVYVVQQIHATGEVTSVTANGR